MARCFPLGQVAGLSLLVIEVIHPSPTYHSVLLTSLVSPSTLVTVSHSLFVLVRVITLVPAHGHPSLAAKIQQFVCHLIWPQVKKWVLIPYHIQPMRSLLGVAQKAGSWAAKGFASSAESCAQPGAQPSMFPALDRARPVTDLGAQCHVFWLWPQTWLPLGFVFLYYLLHPAREACMDPSLRATGIARVLGDPPARSKLTGAARQPAPSTPSCTAVYLQEMEPLEGNGHLQLFLSRLPAQPLAVPGCCDLQRLHTARWSHQGGKAANKPTFSVLLLEKCFCSKALKRTQCSFTSKEYPDTQGKYWPAFSMLISVLLSAAPDSFSEIGESFSPLKNSPGLLLLKLKE